MSKLIRVLEPEVMDTVEDASEYDAMDHRAVNQLFVKDFLQACQNSHIELHGEVLDVGTGTALIPIELCQQQPHIHVTGIDLAHEMLKLAKKNISDANLSQRIKAELVDAKGLPHSDQQFQAVISNSIIHHIPAPETCFKEMVRVLAPGGILFVRDLARPYDAETVNQLVQAHAGNESPYSRQLFKQSLEAALTTMEVHELIQDLPLHIISLENTSNRHWTLAAVRI